MLGWMSPFHDPLSHWLYCCDCPRVARLVIISWVRGAVTWHKFDTTRFILQSKFLTPSWCSCTMVPMEVPKDLRTPWAQRTWDSPSSSWRGNLINVQALWGSCHHFLKEACLMQGTFGVMEKFIKCAVLDSFFQEGFESIFFQESAFSYSLEYVISWCLYLYLSQNHFYSISVFRLLWGTKWSRPKVTHGIMPPTWRTSVWLQDSYSWSYFL